MRADEFLDGPTGKTTAADFLDGPGTTAAPAASWTDNLRDITSALLKIGPTAVKGVADLARLATADRIGVDTSNAMKRGMESFDQVIGSEAMRAQKANINQALQDPNIGITDLPGVVLDNPRAAGDAAVSTIGSMFLPTGVAVGATKLLPTASKVLPALARVTPGAAATGASVVTGAAQNAAETFADTEEQALADRYKGAGISGAASLAIGKLLGGGAEGLVARRLAGETGMRGALAMGKSAVTTSAKEFLQETGEESANYVGKQVAKDEAIDPNTMGKQGLYGGMIGLGVGGASDVATNLANVGQGSAERQIAAAIDQAAQEFADRAPPQTVQQTVARILDRMPARPEPEPAPQPAPGPLALPFDPAVQNPQRPMVADAAGNVRPMDADEQLSQQQQAERMAALGLTPDVQRAINQRQQSPELQPAAAPSDLIQRLMGAGWTPPAVTPETGNAAPAAPAQSELAITPETEKQPILQNRNRATPSSIAQMQSIAASPDYGRLGFSRDFANGAPVVAGGQVAPEQLGRQDVAVASDGRRIPVQYAVVEAADVLPSNRADGTPNADYGNQAVQRIRAIAGNGRIAGLQQAYSKGTTAGYINELASDNLHGVSPDVIRRMRAPVLVRVMPSDQVTADIGDVSNTVGNLNLSAVEQANNDAQRVNLDTLQFAEDGSITPEAVRQFVRAMPQAEQGGLIDTNGQPTKQAVDRINAAVFARAYGNDQLIRLFAQAQDPEARNVMSALAQVAPKMARLEGQGALDIRDVVTQAAEIAVNARREGKAIARAAEQLDLAADPLVGVVLDLFAANPRSVKPVVEALSNAADLAYTEATKPAEDMFGAVPRASRTDVVNQLRPQDERASQENLEVPAGREPVQVDAGRAEAQPAAAADPAATEAGRPAEEEGLTAYTPQEIEDRLAKLEQAERERQQQDREAEQRAQADAERDTFTLTGSDRAADVAAAQGQTDIFSMPAEEADTQQDTVEAAPATEAPRAQRRQAARATEQRNEDVGEQLYANRRNFTGRGIKWEDVANLNDTLKIKEVTKAKVWPRPNYEQLVADGMPAILARMVKQVYDGMSAGPTIRTDAVTDEQLQRYIDTLAKIREGLFNFVNDKQAVGEFASSVLALSNGNRSMAGPISIIDMMKTDVDAKAVSEVLLRRVWPEEYQGAMRPFARGTKANNELAIIGGNKALAALQFLRQDFAKWATDLGKGWPGKREAWEVQGYRVLAPDEYTAAGREQPDGSTRMIIRLKEGRGSWTATFTDEQLANAPFLLVQDGGFGAQTFETREAAIEAAREKVKRKPGAGQDIRGTNIEAAERTGPARREEGEDITSQRLMEAFGFRGVNFGREGWINQAERQAYLNQAYDGLMDLADILGVPAKAMSLNGELGIAFGAQGKGKFAAHFVPGVNEINLTKTKGAGTLAHEWGHALDHHFAKQAGLAKDKEPFLSEHAYKPDAGDRMVFEGGKYVRKTNVPTFGEDIRPQIVQAFRAIYQTMEKRDSSPAETEANAEAMKATALKRLNSWIAAARRPIETSQAENKADLLAEFDQHAEKLREGDTGDGYEKSGKQAYSARVAAIRNLIKDATGRVWSSDETQGLQNNATWVRSMLGQRDADRKHEPQKVSTQYKRDSAAMDKEKGGKAYWSTPTEMFARAFELYVHDKLAQQGALNTFLTDAQQRSETPVKVEDTSSAMGRASGATRDLYLYPTGQERTALRDAFDNLVGAIESRETDKGVMLYDITGLQKDGPISRLPEAPRANVLAKLKALEKRLSDGKISEVEYRAGVQSLIEQIEQRNETRLDRSIIKGRERGPDWITERLIRAKRKGELDPETVDFALWALAKNPALAEDLGISVREQPENQRGTAGDYNPASRVMRLFKDAANETTAVHEILHHTERMMPTDVQNGILKAYQKAWDKAYQKGDEKTRASLQDMLLAQAGDMKAMQRVRDAFGDGSLKYKDHYQLYNASEFWAVNASDILAKRYAVEGSWVGKAKRWLSEMLQYVKGALGLSSDAPVLRGLQAVLNGTGERLTDKMLSGRDDVLQEMGGPDIDPRSLQGSTETWTVPEPGTFDNAVRAIQNNKIDLKRVRDSIQERYGKLSEQADAYLNEELYHGKVAARIETLHKEHIEPILAKIAVAGKNASVSLDDVNLYLHARHAPERNAAMKAINPDMENNEALSGMSNQEAARVMADFTAAGKDKALSLIARDVDQLLADTRTNLVADGLEDAGVIAAWESAYKHYVPLQRDIGSSGTPKGMGFSVRGPEAKRAVGSNKEVVNILANIVTQAETAAIRAEKATVGRSLLAMARQYPNPDFWKVDIPPTKPRINKETGLVQRNAVDPLYQTADNVLMVKDYGQEHFIVFNKNNERAMAVAKAMKNLDIAPMNKILEVANKGTRFLASLLTQRNPLFWLTNFSRDVQGAMLNLEGTEAEGLQREVLGNLSNAFKGMHALVRGEGRGQWARYAQELKDAGGTTGYMQAFENSDARMADITKEVERMQQGKADPRRLARLTLEFVDDYNDIIENAVRLSVFQAAREGGASTAKSASIAKNITVNFNRKGNLTPPINALYMFFNASVQGTARLLQAAATSKTAQAAVGGIAVMGFMLDMLNRMAAGEDDETKRNRYDLIPEFEKSRNWIFMNPMRPGEYVKVPLPLGPHVFHNAGRLMSDALNRDDARNASEYGWSIAGLFLDAFSPLGQAASAGQLIAPSVLDPVLQVTENKSFTGAPVYKSADRFGKTDPKPAYTRYFESTPDVWKGASRMLNDMSGGDKVKPGMVNIQPDILKHVFYTLTGGPGRTLDQAIDSTQAGARGKELTVNRVPLVSRFYGANDDQQRERAYYDDRKRAGDAKTQFDYYIKQGRMDLAREVAKELGDGDEAKGRKQMLEFSRAEKSVRKINGEIRRQMERDDDGDAKAEQLKALRQRRVRVMSDALDDEE